MNRPVAYRRRAVARWLALLTVALALVATGLTTAPRASAAELPLPYASSGLKDTNVPCTPTAEHPYPVVLVHGLVLNGSSTWPVMAPRLAERGYCVFALNYGRTLISGGARVSTSAGQLKTFVTQVLQATGAAKVLIVAHSLGGVVSRYYIDELDGENSVAGLISLASPHRGTLQIAFAGLALALCPACLQVLIGSPLLSQLNSQADVLKPGVRYTQVATRLFDEFVIPPRNSFLPARTGQSVNLWLNDGCGVSISGHLILPSHPVTIALVLSALANDGLAPQPVCGMDWDSA